MTPIPLLPSPQTLAALGIEASLAGQPPCLEGLLSHLALVHSFVGVGLAPAAESSGTSCSEPAASRLRASLGRWRLRTDGRKDVVGCGSRPREPPRRGLSLQSSRVSQGCLNACQKSRGDKSSSALMAEGGGVGGAAGCKPQPLHTGTRWAHGADGGTPLPASAHLETWCWQYPLLPV